MKPPKISKTCACGEHHDRIPESARYQPPGDSFDWLAGWFWECECRSTMFVAALIPEVATA
jgi:hypothetical protein